MLKMVHFLLMTFFVSGVFSFNYGGIPKEFDQRNAQSIISLLESNNTNFNAENFDPKELYNLNWISILADVIKAYNGSKAMKLGDLSVECLNSLQPYAYLLKLKPSDLNPAVLWKILSSPAGKMLDSWGKVPERVLLGNLNWIGAFDECNGENGTKYCMSTMNLFGTASLQGFYGTCLPKQCNSADVHQMLQFVNLFLKGIITFPQWSVTLCNEPLKYESGVIVTIVLLAILLALCLFGSFLEILQDICLPHNLTPYRTFSHQIDDTPTTKNELSSFEQEQNGIHVQDDNVVYIITKPAVRGNIITRLFICFSFIKNIKAILSTKVPKGAIESINGIRTISMTWVILGHYYFFATIVGHVDNILDVGNILHRFSFMPVGNAFVSVDTFFMLGGLLVAYLTLRRMEKFANMSIIAIIFFFLKFYLHRFIRLTPSLAMLILIWNNILPLMVRGPWALWLQQGVYLENMKKPCKDYWWTNILYINNFWPKGFGEECVGWTWYLANDMQFYVVSPVILLVMYFLNKNLRSATQRHLAVFLFISCLCFISFVITGTLIGYYDLPTLQSATGLPGNPRQKNGGKYSDYVYGKPYTRIPPYLVGIFLGYMLSKEIKLTRAKLVTLSGWAAAIIVGLAVVYGPWHVFKPDGHFFNDAENVIYGTFFRWAFTAAVAWVVYACHNNCGGLVNKFLSWRFWIPLSRLTFGAYLLHPLVLVYFYTVHQKSFLYQDNLMVFNFTAVTVISYASAFIFALLVEYPVQNLEKIILT